MATTTVASHTAWKYEHRRSSIPQLMFFVFVFVLVIVFVFYFVI